MSIAFATSASQLVSLGFSVGDIAVLAGAGRHIGTWLMSQATDNSLTEFLKIDIDQVIRRKGLVDTADLNSRWNRKIVLLHNGRLTTIPQLDKTSGRAAHHLGRFTWTMVLLTSVFDAAISPKSLNAFMVRVLGQLFEEYPEGAEYVFRETRKHVEGWRSAACVRGLLQKAQELWETLGRDGTHWPGWIPEIDHDEILRMVSWLVIGTSYRFTTTSSDVYGLAIVLQELGLSSITTREEDDPNRPSTEVDEGQLIVMLTKSERSNQITLKDPRLGVLVPLDVMKNCLSAWPGLESNQNELQNWFANGCAAVIEDGLSLNYGSYPLASKHFAEQVCYKLVASDEALHVEYQDRWSARFATEFLPMDTKNTHKYLDAIGSKFAKLKSLGLFSTIADPSPDGYLHGNDGKFDGEKFAIATVQAFLLGYYYTLLRPLVDTSRLLTHRVVGGWGYGDKEFFTEIRSFVRSKMLIDVSYSRADDSFRPRLLVPSKAVLSLLAYLFAGAEITRSALRGVAITGVIGKLGILPKCYLGTADVEDVGKYTLLDCDLSYVPKNVHDEVKEGDEIDQKPPTMVSIARDLALKWTDLRNHTLPSNEEQDFSSHIEPDWDSDVQQTRLSFRHKGRLVQSMAPTAIRNALVAQARYRRDYWRYSDKQAERFFETRRFSLVKVSDYHAGNIPGIEGDELVVVQVLGKPKARTCIMAMYYLHGLHTEDKLKYAVANSEKEMVLSHALGARVFIVDF